MSSNWIWALDNLASSGVIDFDAPAYILDKNPRYVGHPSRESLPMTNPLYFPDNIKLKDVPELDSYENSKNGDLVRNPSWKKWAFGGVIIAGLIAAGLALSSKKLPKIDLSKIKMPDMSTIKNFGQTVLNYIKKPINWIVSKVKKPSP